MIRISALAVASMVMLSPLAAQAEGPLGTDISVREHVQGQLIVKFSTPDTDLPALGKALGVRFKAQQPLSGGATLLAFESRSGLDALELTKRVKVRPEVEYVQPNWILSAFATPNDELYPDQWHYEQIGLPDAWDITTGSPDIVVAVLDSGSTDHPDLQNKWGDGYDFLSSRFVSADGGGRDDDPTDPGRFPIYHGTHVAGTVGADSDNGLGVAGACWDCPVVPVRVLGSLTGTSADIIDGIRWAAGISVPNTPNNTNPAHIINLSLGGDLGSGNTCANDDPATQSAVDDAVAAGVFVIAAAGNSTLDAGSFTPAGCDDVYTIAATDGSDSLTFYSNFGDVVELSAPGGGLSDPVISTYDVDSYVGYQGTSQASPHVAGVTGLMLSVNPRLSPDDLADILTETAAEMTQRQCGDGCGAGRLDAAAAVQAARLR